MSWQAWSLRYSTTENGMLVTAGHAATDRMVNLLLKVSGAGALAGAVNAWLCYSRLPVPVEEYTDFAWHLVPAGAAHGATLALCASLGWNWTRHFAWPKRIAAAVAMGWTAGFLSWQPLRMSIDNRLGWAAWPFDEGWLGAFTSPLSTFGLVVCVYCLMPAGWTRGVRVGVQSVLLASAAGALGSLWWWIGYGPWYFSLLHGTIWGSAVGLASWTSAVRREAAIHLIPARDRRHSAVVTSPACRMSAPSKIPTPRHRILRQGSPPAPLFSSTSVTGVGLLLTSQGSGHPMAP
jgi:hypothetical protein